MISLLTSMFPEGFQGEIAEVMKETITKRGQFAFIASEFEKCHEKTDGYFQLFLKMFCEIGICFEKSCVVDGRMDKKSAQNTVRSADVVWLSGGDTPTEYRYLQEYGLVDVIRDHPGVVIGMSAGSINLARTVIRTASCDHEKQEIYEGIGRTDFTLEPHFHIEQVSKELLELSKKYIIYGLCDNSMILCNDERTRFFGEIYRLENGKALSLGVTDQKIGLSNEGGSPC